MIASGRHYLEQALIGAIAERRADTAIELIKTIQNYTGNNPPSLTYVDHNKRNFISYALELQLAIVAKALLETGSFDNSAILLETQILDKQTLICRSASANYDLLTEIILQRALKYQEETKSPGRVWAEADSLGNTPLFYSILRGNSKLMNRLVALMEVQDEPDRASLVNHVNREGDTALHLIFRSRSGCEMVDRLLTLGAKMERLNERHETPFGLLSRFVVDEQLEFLMRLSKANQQKLVPLYKDYVVHHPSNEAVRRIYYTLSGISLSLKHLAAAHLEVDPNVKIRNAYFRTVRDGAELRLMYQITPSDQDIHRDLLNLKYCIYLYLRNNQIMMAAVNDAGNIERISLEDDDLRSEIYNPIMAVLQDPARTAQLAASELAALTDIILFHGYKLAEGNQTRLVKQLISDISDPVIVKLLPIYLQRLAERKIQGFGGDGKPPADQLFRQDQNTLLQLIQDIEDYLQDLSGRKPFEKYKLISALVPIAAWAVYIGLEAWLIVGAVREGNNPEASYQGEPMPIMDNPHYIHIINEADNYYNGTWCQYSGGQYYAMHYLRYSERVFRSEGLGKWYNDKCDVKSGFYYLSSIIFGLLGGAGDVILSFMVPIVLCNKVPALNVSKSELSDHIKGLQQQVIEKLEKVHDTDLPIDWRLLNEMADVTSELNKDQTKQQAVALLTKLKAMLTTLQQNLEKSHQPFSSSLFAPVDNREVVIDVSSCDSDISISLSDDEECIDDERSSLLSKKA